MRIRTSVTAVTALLGVVLTTSACSDASTTASGNYPNKQLRIMAPAAPGGGGRGRGQRPVGQGSIDWAKTFQAARIGGVKNYFVEQNMELTRESVAFLKKFSAG